MTCFFSINTAASGCAKRCMPMQAAELNEKSGPVPRLNIQSNTLNGAN